MTVAVKNATKSSQTGTGNALAVSSLLGAVYVVACLAILYGVQRLCTAVVTPLFLSEKVAAAAATGAGFSAVDRALLAVVLVAVVIGLAYLGRKLAGASQLIGMRAGAFLGVVGFLVVILLVRGIGGALEAGGRMEPQTGLIVVAVLTAVLLGAMGYCFFLPWMGRTFVSLEEQGWFSAVSYKRSQGMRVRRATILGFLIIAGFGVYSYRGSLETLGYSDLDVHIPFSGGYAIRLLPDVVYTLPLLLVAGSLWIGWRLVNYPPFADFLIATEAEMNKVSWTTRKRLIQDTIIVLTTMLLLTIFLFVVDVVWSMVLSNRWVPILQNTNPQEQRKLIQQDW